MAQWIRVMGVGVLEGLKVRHVVDSNHHVDNNHHVAGKDMCGKDTSSLFPLSSTTHKGWYMKAHIPMKEFPGQELSFSLMIPGACLPSKRSYNLFVRGTSLHC
jgi:hypothetical protein